LSTWNPIGPTVWSSGSRMPARMLRYAAQADVRLTVLAGHADHGSMSAIPRSVKWRVFLVASCARRADAIPAIWTSRISTGRPARWRPAAISPAAIAADVSKDWMRPSSSSVRSASNARSRSRRRRPGVRRCRPVLTSKTVIDVVQIDSAACASSQLTTAASGSRRISAEITLVSSKITRRNQRGGPGRATRRCLRVSRSPRTSPRSATRAQWARGPDRVRRCAGSREPLPPCCGHGLWLAAAAWP